MARVDRAPDLAFARSLLRLRVAAGLTQSELAWKAGLPGGSVVARIEVHGRGCTLRTAHAIALALDTGVDAMIAEDDLKAVARG